MALEQHTVDETNTCDELVVNLQILSQLFEPSLLKSYRRMFSDSDTSGTGKVSKRRIIAIVAELCVPPKKQRDAVAFDVASVLTQWFDVRDEMRRHRTFEFKTLMLALAFAKHQQRKQRMEQSMASALDGRFASAHESKRQLELWQQKLGHRTFDMLQRAFQDASLPSVIPARVRVSVIGRLFDEATRSAAPNKPLEVYLQQMDLLPHHTLLLPEFLCCYYQLYGSSDSSSGHMHRDALELRPIAFVASCLFSNGDAVCDRHGDLVRRLSVGRTPAQQDLILRFRDVFEALESDAAEAPDRAIATSQLRTFAAKVVHDPTILEAAIQTLRKRAATVSLVEVFASCGFVIDELTAAPTISNAIEKLRLRVEAADVRRIISVVRTICLKVLRFPNNSDYWRIRADSDAFQQKLGRFDGAMHLMEAVGFVECHKTHFELRGARTSDGKRASVLSKAVLDRLRESCVELDAELSLFDGVESIGSILQRIASERGRSAPLTLDECHAVLTHLSTYIETVLKNPKDARCWRIREANKTFQRQVGYLPSVADLMASIGYELVETSQGNVYALRGTGTLATTDASKSGGETSLSNFAFSRVSEQMEWFLWRKKQEIDALLQDEMQYLVDVVVHSRAASASESTRALPGASAPNVSTQDLALVKMYPYGKNALDIFSNSAVQRQQIEMMKTCFRAMDSAKRGFLLEEDFVREPSSYAQTPRWLRFEAFDTDMDGKVDFGDFVAALGPLVDHPFDTAARSKPLASAITNVSLTLCEKVALAIGRLRLSTSLPEGLSALRSVLTMLHKIAQEPAKAEFWCVHETSDVWLKLLRVHAGRDLLEICGFTDLESAGRGACVGHKSGAKFALVPSTLRFKTFSASREPSQSLDDAAISHLQTVAAVVAGHCRGIALPEVSDVSAVSRAIGRMDDRTGWIRLVELALLCIKNVLKHPEDEWYRHLNTVTQTYTTVVRNVRGGHAMMLSLGFRPTDAGTLVLPSEVSTAMLTARQLELDVGLALLRAQPVDNAIVASASPVTRMNRDRPHSSGRMGSGDTELEQRRKQTHAAHHDTLTPNELRAKQLEMLAEARGGRKSHRGRGGAIGRGRGHACTGPGNVSRRDQTRGATIYDSDSLEAEILSELSPRVQHSAFASQRRGGSSFKQLSHARASTRNVTTGRGSKTQQRRPPTAPV